MTDKKLTTEEIAERCLIGETGHGHSYLAAKENIVQALAECEAKYQAEIERLEAALRLIAFDYHEDNPAKHFQKYTPSQIALHAIRIEPLQP